MEIIDILAKHILKKTLKVALPKRVINLIKLSESYLYDVMRYIRLSGFSRDTRQKTYLRAKITKDYHRLEKGLSFREPRLNFGEHKIWRLISNIEKYFSYFGRDKMVEVAVNVLTAYQNYHTDKGSANMQISMALDRIRKTLSRLCEGDPKPEMKNEEGGVFHVTREAIHHKSLMDLTDFFNSRFSIRNFGAGEVKISELEKAIALAQKTPSVCNRQTSKVYVFCKKKDIERILRIQKANRGFEDQIDKVLIVTSEIGHFMSIGERNQCWIDGGMFAMSLVYALHSLGLGTCCLNWSKAKKQDLALRAYMCLPDSEVVIMMIAVGMLPDQFCVAQSPRKVIEDVLVLRK